MMNPRHTLSLVAAVALAACDTHSGPVEVESSVLTADVAAAATTATVAFSIRTLDVTGTVEGLLWGASINEIGQVAGAWYPDGSSLADGDFIWSPITGMVTKIPKDPISFAFGTHLNDGGTVAGTGGCGTLCYRAYRWTGGVATDLDPLPGDDQSFASDINNAGIIVGGSSSTADLATRTAVRWLADGTVEPLGTLLPGEGTRAHAINNPGHIVGDAGVGGDMSAPFLWTEADGMTRLVELEAAVMAVSGATYGRIVPTAINESGEIAGYWTATGSSVRNPYFWSPVEGLVDFNTLGDFGDGISISMNDLGEVTFTIVEGSSPPELTPWFWSRAAGFVRLPVLLPGQTAVQDINNESVIVGRGGRQADLQTVLWTPVTSAADALDLLEETLDDVLAGGGLDVEGGNGLRAKLDRIREHIDAGRTAAARNQLAAFINQVETMIADGRLTEAEGAALLADAETLRALL
jgi:uncharacterized membrane protein